MNLRTTLVAATLALVACGASEPAATITDRPIIVTTPDIAIGNWYADNADLLDDVQNDIGAIGDAANASDLAGVGDACTDLGYSAQAALDADPIPDTEIDGYWQEALDHYIRGAALCEQAVYADDYDLLGEAADEIADGGNQLDLASTALESR